MRTDVATRLRAETRALHDRLESDLSLLTEPMTVQRYRRLIERFTGFHAVLEPRLDAWHETEQLLDWPERRKLASLHADLVRLGVSPDDAARLPACPEVPQVTGTSDAMGVLYVVEGATLGGQIIVRHLRSHAAIPAEALTFLSSYGADVGPRWRRWRRVTEEWVGVDADRADAVVAHASATFACLADWLRPVGRGAAA